MRMIARPPARRIDFLGRSWSEGQVIGLATVGIVLAALVAIRGVGATREEAPVAHARAVERAAPPPPAPVAPPPTPIPARVVRPPAPKVPEPPRLDGHPWAPTADVPERHAEVHIDPPRQRATPKPTQEQADANMRGLDNPDPFPDELAGKMSRDWVSFFISQHPAPGGWDRDLVQTLVDQGKVDIKNIYRSVAVAKIDWSRLPTPRARAEVRVAAMCAIIEEAQQCGLAPTDVAAIELLPLGAQSQVDRATDAWVSQAAVSGAR